MPLRYKVWFVQNRKTAEYIDAKNKEEARKIFAEKHNVIVSNYIQARRDSIKQYNF